MEDTRRRIRAEISRKKRQLIQKAIEANLNRDMEGKTDADMRLRYLIKMKKEYNEEWQVNPMPKMFVSYSKRSGAKYFSVVSSIAEEYNLEVLTGFDRKREENVLHAVMKPIGEAAVFLSIMTEEYSIKMKNKKGRYMAAPSVWLLEEKGIALAMGKPFRMLVDEKIHEDFWRKTTPEKLASVFGPQNFEEKAREAISALEVRHEELLARSPNLY